MWRYRWRKPSFWQGVAQAFDLSGSIARRRADAILAVSDADAIADDWRAIAGDLSAASLSERRQQQLDRIDELLRQIGTARTARQKARLAHEFRVAAEALRDMR